MAWYDFLKLDPTITDPAVALASGITTDKKGIIHQKRTAASEELSHSLAQIAPLALMPAISGFLTPTTAEPVLVGSRALPSVINTGSRALVPTNTALATTTGAGRALNGLRSTVNGALIVSRGMYLPGKTQPLLGMSKSLPSVVSRGSRALVPTNTALATTTGAGLTTTGNVVSTGSKLAKGVAGTVALGTAVGQGMSEPSQKKVVLGSPKNKSKAPVDRLSQKLYNQLLKLSHIYGGLVIQRNDGTYMLKNQNGTFYGKGRAFNAKTGKMLNYDLWGSGHFINSNSKLAGNNDVVAKVTDSNYLYGYTGKNPLPGANTNTKLPRINNTAEGKHIMNLQKKLGVKADGWWGKNTAAAYAKYKKLLELLYIDNVRNNVQSPSLPASMVQQNTPTLEELGLDSNSLLKYRKGGMLVNKYQQGGTTSDPMDLLAQVAAKFLQGDAQSGQQLAQVFSDQKVGKQLMQAVLQGVQQQDKRAIIIAQAIQALSGSRKARLGAKLNYFHKDICPAGEKLVYFKKGGEICKACQKMDMGGEMADDQRKAKPSLTKKPQSKPIQNKQKINLKPNNKRPGPKDLKSLPNGKYPAYWTADLRGQWDRDHDEGV